MVSNIEGVTYNSPNVPMTSKPSKKPSTRESLCLFTNIFDVKKKTAKSRVGAAESKCRAMKVGNSLWTNTKNEKGILKSMGRSNVICMHG